MEEKMDLAKEKVVQVAVGGIKILVAVPKAVLVTVMAVAVAKAPDGKDKVNPPCRGFSTSPRGPRGLSSFCPGRGF